MNLSPIHRLWDRHWLPILIIAWLLAALVWGAGTGAQRAKESDKGGRLGLIREE